MIKTLWLNCPKGNNYCSFFRNDDSEGTSEIIYEELEDKSNIWTRIDFPLNIRDKPYQVKIVQFLDTFHVIVNPESW